MQRAFAEPRVHANVEPLQRSPDPLHGPRDRLLGHPGAPVLRRQVQQRAAVVLRQLLGEVGHVRAPIPTLGDRRVDAEDLQVAGLERLAEQLDLPPGVVEVVLASDVVPGGAQDVGEGVADRGVAGGPDVQRSDRVRADELHLDRPAVPFRPTEPVTLVDDLADGVVQPGRPQEQVDEPRPRDLRPIDHAGGADPGRDGLGDLAWRATDLGGDHQGQVRRPVAVLLRPRPRQLGLGQHRWIQPDLGSRGRGRLGEHP